MILKRVGPLSAAKMAGILYAAIGLLVGGIFSLFSMFGSMFMPREMMQGPFGGALFGIGAIIILPLFYGALGFCVGGISAAVFNVAARVVGGVQLDLE